MNCPYCQADKDALKVIDSRTAETGRAIRRRRQCTACHKRFTTYERIETAGRMTVVKKDGQRQPWDREKIIAGLERATFKRSIPHGRLERLAEEVREEADSTFEKEVPAEWIGKQVAERLRRLDQVAYVRFASVYRKFSTLEELIDESQAVLDAQRFEDPPGQGRLFLDANGRARKAAEPS